MTGTAVVTAALALVSLGTPLAVSRCLIPFVKRGRTEPQVVMLEAPLTGVDSPRLQGSWPPRETEAFA